MMSVVIRQMVFLTSSASWRYSFKSRDSAGTAPNNIIAKARKLMELKITILARSPTGTCQLQCAQVVGCDSAALAEEHLVVQELIEHNFPAHNLDELPRSSTLAGLVE